MARSSTVKQEIERAILGKIFSGEIAPGTRLVESELATELGVSRVPIREVLTRLVARGLLQGGVDGQGTRMRVYSPEEIRHLYSFRGVIESGVMRLLVVRGGNGVLEDARMCCDAMEELLDQQDPGSWAELDHRFHMCLADSTGNERLVHSLDLLLSECHYLFYGHPRSRQLGPDPEKLRVNRERVLQEHRDLLDALEAGNADKAVSMVETGMQSSASRICRMMITALAKPL